MPTCARMSRMCSGVMSSSRCRRKSSPAPQDTSHSTRHTRFNAHLDSTIQSAHITHHTHFNTLQDSTIQYMFHSRLCPRLYYPTRSLISHVHTTKKDVKNKNRSPLNQDVSPYLSSWLWRVRPPSSPAFSPAAPPPHPTPSCPPCPGLYQHSVATHRR